jgi:hypothetical protein
MSAAIYISVSLGIVVGALLGLFLGAIITANQRKEQDDRIVILEKAGEDLSCAAWSVGSDLEDAYDPDTINNEMGLTLKKAAEKWHQATFGEPIKPAKK